MAARDMGVCRAMRGASDRQTVLVEGRQVVVGGFVKPAAPLRQTGKAEVGFGEARVPRENRLVAGRRTFRDCRIRRHGQLLCRGPAVAPVAGTDDGNVDRLGS